MAISVLAQCTCVWKTPFACRVLACRVMSSTWTCSQTSPWWGTGSRCAPPRQLSHAPVREHALCAAIVVCSSMCPCVRTPAPGWGLAASAQPCLMLIPCCGPHCTTMLWSSLLIPCCGPHCTTMRPLKAFAPVCLVHRCMPCAPSSLVQDRVWCWMDLHSGELLRSTHPRTL